MCVYVSVCGLSVGPSIESSKGLTPPLHPHHRPTNHPKDSPHHTHHTTQIPPHNPPSSPGKVGYRVNLANRGDEQDVRPFKVAFDLGNVRAFFSVLGLAVSLLFFVGGCLLGLGPSTGRSIDARVCGVCGLVCPSI